MLADCAEKAGAEVRYRHEVIAIDLEADKPSVTVKSPDGEIYQVLRRVIVASLKGQPQPMVIEAARTAIAPANQPSFSEVFDGMRAK